MDARYLAPRVLGSCRTTKPGDSECLSAAVPRSRSGPGGIPAPLPPLRVHPAGARCWPWTLGDSAAAAAACAVRSYTIRCACIGRLCVYRPAAVRSAGLGAPPAARRGVSEWFIPTVGPTVGQLADYPNGRPTSASLHRYMHGPGGPAAAGSWVLVGTATARQATGRRTSD